MMRRTRVVVSVVAMAVLLVAAGGHLVAQAGRQAPAARKAFAVAKTPWGDPDLQGVFTNNNESGIPFERPNEFQGKTLEDVSDAELAKLNEERETRRVAAAPNLGVLPGSNPVHWFENFGAANSRAWLVVDPPDGRVPPLTPEAQKRPRAAGGGSSFGNGPFNTYTDFSLYDRCVTRGYPGSMMPAIYGNAYEIVQGPGWVAINYEMIHETRVIPLDSRPAPGSGVRTYMGVARGRFEGNTLVVETTNFRDGQGYRGANPATVKIIERFTQVSAEQLEWAVTVEDPTTWTRPWTFAMNLTRGGDDVRPFEYACHEGNYGLANMLTAARAAEAAAR